MASDWVNDKLDNWARWVVERDAGAAGYPRQAAFVGLRTKSSSTDNIPVSSIDARHTDEAVTTLRYSDSHLWLVLMCRYVGDPRAPQNRRKPMLWREVGVAMAITPREARSRLDDAKALLAATLGRRGVLR